MNFNIFKSIPLYLKLYKNKVEVTRLDTEITITRKAIKPFSNSRMVFADFETAEILLKEVFNELIDSKSILRPSLKILVQQFDLLEDGLSQVEKRAIFDSCEHSNAKEIYLIEDRIKLSNYKALSKLKELSK